MYSGFGGRPDITGTARGTSPVDEIVKGSRAGESERRGVSEGLEVAGLDDPEGREV